MADNIWDEATRISRAMQLFKWLDGIHLHFDKLSDFHELAVQFAEGAFYSKTDHKPIILYLFQRHDGISVMETMWESAEEKHAVMASIRSMCSHDIAVAFGMNMMATINEVWIAASYDVDPKTGKAREDLEELRRKYKEVRYFPNREDGLLVQSYERGGSSLITKWVAKVKEDPAKSYLLARDDMEVGGEQLGPHTGYFEPEREIP